jgi:hypothetical protein
MNLFIEQEKVIPFNQSQFIAAELASSVDSTLPHIPSEKDVIFEVVEDEPKVYY